MEWLEGQDVHTLHTFVRRRFPRRNCNFFYPHDVWGGDLVDLSLLKTYNFTYTYLLVIIHVLSKYAWVKPIYDKRTNNVAAAFERILSRCNGQWPFLFSADQGAEFTGKEMQAILKMQNITLRITQNPDVEAAVVARFNRTLKGRIWRYFTRQHTR